MTSNRAQAAKPRGRQLPTCVVSFCTFEGTIEVESFVVGAPFYYCDRHYRMLTGRRGEE